MAGEYVLGLQVTDDGEIVGASAGEGANSVRFAMTKKVAEEGGGATLEVFEGGESILIVTGQSTGGKRMDDDATSSITFKGEGVEHRVISNRSSGRMSVISANDSPIDVDFDFNSWSLVSREDLVGKYALPVQLEKKLRPLRPAFQALGDHYARQSEGAFSAVSGKRPQLPPRSADFDIPAWACHAVVWAEWGAIGVLCCTLTCPKTACIGCVLCAAASGGTGSLYADMC